MDCDNVLFNESIINDINEIGCFLAKRDLIELSKCELSKRYGINNVNLIVLLGNSITYSIEVAKSALANGLGHKVMIVGGIGHSTKYLSDNIKIDKRYRNINVNNRSEADMIRDILIDYYKVDENLIIIENNSTNCGDNAYKAIDCLKEKGIEPTSMLLIQDPTMQLRSFASFQKAWQGEKKVQFINYAPFIPKLKLINNEVIFENGAVDGLWSLDRYLSLIMGEIPRLRDDGHGYGPNGRNYIEHVDIPNNVLQAYDSIKTSLSSYLEDRKIK